MSAAAVELLGKVALGHPVPMSLVEQVDTVALATMATDFCGWHIPHAAEILRRPARPGREPVSGSTAAAAGGAVPPVLFVLAVLRGDDSAIAMAGEVNPIALALFCLTIMEMPAVVDPEALLTTYALARTLEDG